MTNIPRGKFLGRLLGDPPKGEAEHSIRCLPVAVGSIAVISAKCSTRRSLATPSTGPAALTGAQFEIRTDGTPRTYRDRKDYAMEAARLIKEQEPA